jgi:NDP-sugar pyrophosphorylase family protein
MKIIVPMAGRGSRLRPHTLTIPKPLIPVGGKTYRSPFSGRYCIYLFR